MTHAAKSHDAIERLIALRETITARLAEEESRSQKLSRETDAIELSLTLADALAILRDMPTQNLSEGKRTRLAAVKKRLLAEIERRAA